MDTKMRTCYLADSALLFYWYHHTCRCWLRYDTNFIWAFISPVIVIILVGSVLCMCSQSLHPDTSSPPVQCWIPNHGTDYYVPAPE